MGLVALPQTTPDGDGVLHRGLTDEDLLETTLQGRVLLDVLAVLVKGGRADHPQLTASQHRLEHIAGVHRAFARSSGTDDGVQLIDEGDDVPLGLLDLVEDGLETFLELAAVLGARDHRGQVQGDDPATLQGVGDVPGHHSLGQPLDDGGLADTGLADEDRVVLGTSRQDLDDATDLLVATDDWVELAGASALGEIDGVLGQGGLSALGLLGGDATVTTSLVESGRQGIGLEAETRETALDVGGNRRQGDEEVFGGDEGVTHGLSTVLCVGNHPSKGTRELRLGDGCSRARRQGTHGGSCDGVNPLRIDAQASHQGADGVVRDGEKSMKKMRGLHGRIPVGQRVPSGGGDRVTAHRGEIGVHYLPR